MPNSISHDSLGLSVESAEGGIYRMAEGLDDSEDQQVENKEHFGLENGDNSSRRRASTKESATSKRSEYVSESEIDIDVDKLGLDEDLKDLKTESSNNNKPRRRPPPPPTDDEVGDVDSLELQGMHHGDERSRHIPKSIDEPSRIVSTIGGRFDGEQSSDNNRLTQVRMNKLPDGSCYVGEHVGTQRNGIGVFRSVRFGFLYRGEWKDNVEDGYGDLFMEENGTRFEGLFAKGRCRGPGRKLWKDGTTYVGEFDADGNPSGLGILSSGSGETVCGQFRAGHCHGLGKCFFSNGNSYVGNFSQGKRHGLGAMLYERKDSVAAWEESGMWRMGTFIQTVPMDDEFRDSLHDAEMIVLEASEFCDSIQADIIREVHRVKRAANQLCNFAREKLGIQIESAFAEPRQPTQRSTLPPRSPPPSPLTSQVCSPSATSSPPQEREETLDAVSDMVSLTTATWEDEEGSSVLDEQQNGQGKKRESKPMNHHTNTDVKNDDRKGLSQKPKQEERDPKTLQILADMQRGLMQRRETNSYWSSGSPLSQRGASEEDADEPLAAVAATTRINSIRDFISSKFGTQLKGKSRSASSSPVAQKRSPLPRVGMLKPTNGEGDGGDDSEDDQDLAQGSMLSAKQYALLWRSLHPGTAKQSVEKAYASVDASDSIWEESSAFHEQADDHPDEVTPTYLPSSMSIHKDRMLTGSSQQTYLRRANRPRPADVVSTVSDKSFFPPSHPPPSVGGSTLSHLPGPPGHPPPPATVSTIDAFQGSREASFSIYSDYSVEPRPPPTPPPPNGPAMPSPLAQPGISPSRLLERIRSRTHSFPLMPPPPPEPEPADKSTRTNPSASSFQSEQTSFKPSQVNVSEEEDGNDTLRSQEQSTQHNSTVQDSVVSLLSSSTVSSRSHAGQLAHSSSVQASTSGSLYPVSTTSSSAPHQRESVVSLDDHRADTSISTLPAAGAESMSRLGDSTKVSNATATRPSSAMSMTHDPQTTPRSSASSLGFGMPYSPASSRPQVEPPIAPLRPPYPPKRPPLPPPGQPPDMIPSS